MRLLGLTLAALLSFSLHAKHIQSIDNLSIDDKPMGLVLKLTTGNDSLVSLPAMDTATLSAKSPNKNSVQRTLQFAQPVTDKSIWDNKGQWTIVNDTAVYQVTFTGDDALSLNVGLVDVFLPVGTKLYFYTPEGQQLVMFDEHDNKQHQQIWSPIFTTKKLTLEINVPAKMMKKTRFTVQQVAQGYREIQGGVVKSGDCNINTICPEGDAWRDQIDSVARYVISGTSLCTGTLVNNVEEDRKPYFLTANHCGVDVASAPSMVLYWNFATSICDLNTPMADGSLDDFQTGAVFRAADEDTDMALVELDASPAEFGVFYSGWNNSDAIPNSAVGIHHPRGDEKRISFDNDPLTVTNFSETVINNNGDYFRVGAWDLGTTEGGSSGSAIWDENGLIVGTLTGGFASCQAPGESDWYGRIASQWQANDEPSGQLKAWLDPNDTGTQVLAGLQECEAPTVTIEIDNNQPSLGETVTVSATVTGGSGADYTFTWDVNADGVTDSNAQSFTTTYDYFYTGNILVNVADGASCSAREVVAVEVQSENEVFTTTAEIPDGWVDSANSSASWAVVEEDAFEGNLALRSGLVTDNNTSSIETTHNFTGEGDSFIAFAYRVSSEPNFDFLRFYIDEQLMLSVSGETEWLTIRFPLTAGEHTLRWSYEKDFSVSEGADAAWIDGVTGIQIANSEVEDPPVITPPPTNNTPPPAVPVTTNDSGGGALSSISLLFLVLVRLFVRRQAVYG